jgi:hypothetical protein
LVESRGRSDGSDIYASKNRDALGALGHRAKETTATGDIAEWEHRGR